MSRILVKQGHSFAAIAVTVLLAGCGMCQNCYDYSPPVIGSVHSTGDMAAGGRSGSVVTGAGAAAGTVAEVPAEGEVIYE